MIVLAWEIEHINKKLRDNHEVVCDETTDANLPCEDHQTYFDSLPTRYTDLAFRLEGLKLRKPATETPMIGARDTELPKVSLPTFSGNITDNNVLSDVKNYNTSKGAFAGTR